MTPFSDIFDLNFFIYLGFVVLAVAGLVMAIASRRSQAGRVSLFLLLTTALVTSYYTLQWLFNSFAVYFINNYMVSHPDFQVPDWTMIVLNYLVLALNVGFVATLALTAWFSVRKSHAEKSALAQSLEETGSEEVTSEVSVDAGQFATPGDDVAPVDPPVAGPEV
ncbi:MAG TPA: hypothetical protein VN478_05190 [Clostridia bacterium]|nr:hypothetical protein [Clostridia bacterium]